mmetsp:Transcript_2515/g.7544  ORF Transcript_2515/g.7544 Transcript_2515/m.7544 type:complete len:222 (-) Transcript_2515:594-1259(-)
MSPDAASLCLLKVFLTFTSSSSRCSRASRRNSRKFRLPFLLKSTCAARTCTSSSFARWPRYRSMSQSSSMSTCPLQLSSKRSKVARSSAASALEKPSRFRKCSMRFTNSSKSRMPSFLPLYSSAASSRNSSTVACDRLKPSARVSLRSSEMSMLLLPSLSNILNFSRMTSSSRSRSQRAQSTASGSFKPWMLLCSSGGSCWDRMARTSSSTLRAVDVCCGP